MKVLVACEYSGRVREAFRALGHDAWSCDLLPADDCSEHHYHGNALDLLKEDWDLLIAHPPCTYLSNAGAKHLYPIKGNLNLERYAQGLEAKDFFMQFYNADIPKICVENPIPSKVFEMPPYSQFVQPWEHGHSVSKKTCFWLKGLPPLLATDIVAKTENCHGAKGSWYNQGGKDRWKRRSTTFQGIADAMAAQWG
ncbi:putative DNA methylase [uncultured Mediterranean phage uvMED]|nr:putative DNA methylase [uncultured Mediterranean phage uvMED]